MHMINKQKIVDEIKLLIPEYISFLQKLVSFNSVYTKEKEAQLFVKSKMESLGLDVETFFSREDDQSINLVARIHGTERDKYKSLILNSHCDITPIDNIERWSDNPFSGEIINNVLYGRGSQDDKAGIAIILLVIHVLQNLKISLKGDIITEIVIDDETTGNGSKVLVQNGFTADGVIIVDGTWSGQIIYAHLGQVWLDVDIIGEPVAACVENRGVNPIYIACEFIQKLREAINSLKSDEIDFENIKNPYFINVGSFHSGVWHGSVPANAKLEIQIGFSNKHTPDEIINHVIRVAKNISERIIVKEGLLKTPACKKIDNLLIKKLKAIIKRNMGINVLTTAVTGHCDMRHFPTENICLYGPGGGKNPHGLNECYFLEEMPKVANSLLDFILEWCNELK